VGKIDISKIYEQRISEITELIEPKNMMPENYIVIGMIEDQRIKKVYTLRENLYQEMETLIEEYNDTFNSSTNDAEKRQEILFQKLNVSNTLISITCVEVSIYLTEKFPSYKENIMFFCKGWYVIYPDNITKSSLWNNEDDEEDDDEDNEETSDENTPEYAGVTTYNPKPDQPKPETSFFVIDGTDDNAVVHEIPQGGSEDELQIIDALKDIFNEQKEEKNGQN